MKDIGWLKRAFAAVAAVVLLSGWASRATAQFDGPGGAGEPILTVATDVSHTAVMPGDTIWLAATLDLLPSWHVNSAHPLKDYLIPTVLEFKDSEHLTFGEIRYPRGHEIPLQGETLSVYESGARIFIPVTPQASAPMGPIRIEGTLKFQGCDDNACIAPDKADLAWVIKVSDVPGAVIHESIFQAVTGAAEVTAGRGESESLPAGTTSDLQRLIDEHGFWGYVLAFALAFGTGLLLSFSPCTYPMIPITVSIFAGQARGAGRGFVLSLIYVLTMALLYGIMGTVIASVGGVFGAWLAHPVVVGVIVAIFFIFALSMFGLYELQVPESLRSKMAGKGGEGIGGAIVLGAVAALVVSPCVGPFVAGIMLYVATTGSPLLGFSVLFTFALGLGTLFLIIGTFSSAINALPNAGMWMESVKKFFGFVLLLMALYFARTLMADEITALLAGLLFLSAGVFGGGFDRLTSESGFFPRLKKAFGVLCVILGIYFFGGYLLFSGVIWPPLSRVGVVGAAAHSEREVAWTTDFDRALGRAQSEGKPVLIDTWATWCANCKRLDRTTWVDAAVVAESERFVAVKLQLETTDDPMTRKVLGYFNLKQYSLPTIILIDSQGTPEIIQGYVNPKDMLARMRKTS